MTGRSLVGRLLVSSPGLRDPNFARTVVLVLDHDDAGALGLVINRPSDVPVSRVLAPWRDLVAEPAVMFQGGPVQTDGALALAEVPVEEEPVGWRRLFSRVGLVDLDAPPELLAGGLRAMRIFAGYAGWAPGQLEQEVEAGGWFVVEAERDDAFSDEPAGMWRRVLRRQAGELALVSSFPDDPTMN